MSEKHPGAWGVVGSGGWSPELEIHVQHRDLQDRGLGRCGGGICLQGGVRSGGKSSRWLHIEDLWRENGSEC